MNAYIRIVFSSLMVLPIVILVYFMIHVSEPKDCFSWYVKNKPTSTLDLITWPDNGLVTLWFDSTFYAKNAKTILQLMEKYQFAGVISLSNGKSCHSQYVSMRQLDLLHHQGWEVTEMNQLPVGIGLQEINEMPVTDPEKLAIYDMAHHQSDATLRALMENTKTRNGWLILYFPFSTDATGKLSNLEHTLQMVKGSGMPVVLQAQVLKVSA